MGETLIVETTSFRFVDEARIHIAVCRRYISESSEQKLSRLESTPTDTRYSTPYDSSQVSNVCHHAAHCV